MSNLILVDEVKKEVVYSNDFSEVIFTNYNLRHKKLLLLLIAGLNETDKTYTFEGKLIKSIMNMEKQSYKEFSKILIELQDKPFLMLNKKTEDVDRISIFDKITFTKDKKILVTFGNSAKEIFLDLKGNFSKFLVKNIENLSISNSIDLYLRSESNLFKTGFSMSLDDIRKYFEVNYKTPKDIETRIIKPCCIDISNNTDIAISYEKLKQGRNVLGYKFSVNRKFKISEELNIAIEHALKNIYIKKSKVLTKKESIFTLVNEFSEEKLILGLKYCYRNINKEFKTLTYLKNTIKNMSEESINLKSNSLSFLENTSLTTEMIEAVFEEFEKLDEYEKLKIEEIIFNSYSEENKKILDYYLMNGEKQLFYSTIKIKLCDYLVENRIIRLPSQNKKSVKKGRGRRKKIDMLEELDMVAETTRHERKIINFMKKKLGSEQTLKLLQKNRLKYLTKYFIEILKSKEAVAKS